MPTYFLGIQFLTIYEGHQDEFIRMIGQCPAQFYLKSPTIHIQQVRLTGSRFRRLRIFLWNLSCWSGTGSHSSSSSICRHIFSYSHFRLGEQAGIRNTHNGDINSLGADKGANSGIFDSCESAAYSPGKWPTFRSTTPCGLSMAALFKEHTLF